jgi:hypothetical protein
MSNLYIGTTQMKAELRITGTASDSIIQDAAETASRVIDSYKGVRDGNYSGTVSQTRYYSPHSSDIEVEVDEFMGTATVTLDATGNGSYDTSWTQGTEFTAQPVNNSLDSKPFRRIRIRRQSGACFSGYDNALKVEADFGWATTPPQVERAASILAARLYNRRDAVFGVLNVGAADAIAVRLPRTDPDVAQLLDSVDSRQPRSVA